MSDATPTRQATFRIQANTIAYDRWLDLCKAIEARRAARQTEGRQWWRIDGQGYTLWLSNIRSIGKRTDPPTWEFRLETLVALNAEGQRRWGEICQALEAYCNTAQARQDSD